MSETTQPKYAPREYLSVSTLMSFIRCPRSYYYQKCGISPREEPAALNYGTAMHKAVPLTFTKGLDAAYEAFLSVWGDVETDEKRNPRRAKAQLSHFCHSHQGGRSIYNFEPPPAGTIKLDEETSEYEVPAVVDIGLPIPLVVRIDGLVRHRDTNELWGWEFKTTSRLNANLFEGMEMNPQVLTYTMALQTLTGQRVRGIIAEAMLIDKTKVDNMAHPIVVQDHMVKSITTWHRYWGQLLLACEAREAELGAEAFIKNFAGCSAYPLYYMPSFACGFSNLCRVDNWKDMVGFYNVKPDHKFVKLTTEGT